MNLNPETEYSFKAKPFHHSPTGGWVFVALPVKVSAQIRQKHKWDEEGWGRLKARACINNTEWNSAIWFDTKQNTYLLPLKAEIRKKENIEAGKTLRVSVFL
jgi:hypothetical protein